MAKADLGDKQVCPSCGAKFYDLGKRPAVCPKCQTAFDPQDEAIRLKRVRGRPASYDDEEAKADSDEEAEAPEAVELDEAAAEQPVEDLDADEEGPANSDEIPAGFSEDVGDDEAGPEDDDTVPIIEDDEEKFPEGEIEIGGDDEKEPS